MEECDVVLGLVLTENAVKITLSIPPRGAIAQLGERVVRNDEAVGSIPTSSTIFSNTCEIPSRINSRFVSWVVS